jgi:hypothetical protein
VTMSMSKFDAFQNQMVSCLREQNCRQRQPGSQFWRAGSIADRQLLPTKNLNCRKRSPVFESFVQATSPFSKAKVSALMITHVTRARCRRRSEPHEPHLESNNGSSDTCSRVGQDMERAKIGTVPWHCPIVTNCFATK